MTEDEDEVTRRVRECFNGGRLSVGGDGKDHKVG